METKEKTPVTALAMKEVLKGLLRENIVGFVCVDEGNAFDFSLAGGQRFRISVGEVEKESRSPCDKEMDALQAGEILSSC